MAGRKVLISLLGLAALGGCATQRPAALPLHEARVLQDTSRQRAVPVQIDRPAQPRSCVPAHRCPVAFFSHGYGVPNTAYAFVARALNQLGYVVVSVQHDLPTDPPLASTGTLITLDNRRVPLPREARLRVLSLRGSDFAADPGVLPSAGESRFRTSACTELQVRATMT